MKTLTVENFGIIKSASINLKGLTVIAGNNDTGKSSIGKLFYTIIKALKSIEYLDEEKTKDFVRKEIDNLYLFLRDKPDVANIRFGIDYFTDKFIDELLPYINDRTLHDRQKERFNLCFTEREKILTENNLFTKYPNEILQNIKNLLKDERYDENTLMAEQLNKYLQSDFFWNITPLNTNLQTNIDYIEGDIDILAVKIDKNKLIATDYFGDSHFDDATFIEAPIILEISNLINNIDDENNHIADLIKKLQKTYVVENEIANEIEQIIKGKFYFDKKERLFYYLKDTKRIEALNVASGINSFGILQLLAKADFIKSKKLLIIDEPENHLHPEWQLLYAKLLIELVKKDITIIVSTHSPYLLQALKHYGSKEKQDNKISYYLSELNEDNTSTIKNVSDDLNKIFSKLAKPLTDLVWM